MESFRTTLTIPPIGFRIDHNTSGVMLGSCFADTISSRMVSAKFNIEGNPFGTIYNPVSIAQAIHTLAQGKQFTIADLNHNDDLWYSFAHHGSFSATSAQQALDNINTAVTKGSQALKNADYVVITLGTSWVYYLARTEQVVANCHKLPEKNFTRRRMTVEQITEILYRTIETHLKNKHIIFTVSPIRHIKDGLIQNQRSKATLIESVHRVIDILSDGEKYVGYFPAYEIMADDLRDYRFYDRDMIHPSQQAVDYIWDQFCHCSMDQKTFDLIKRIKQITSAANHRPMHIESPSYNEFMNKMHAQSVELQMEHPEIDLNSEIAYFEQNMS